jgi:lipopolysaccharide/colanic/teichoic acid biosynthesis glycosyltransferase
LKTRKRSESRRFGYLLAKRTLDLLVSGVGLVALIPVFGMVSLLVLLDDGVPVLYGHVRQTRGGRRFRCWKFRTMSRNADALKSALGSRNTCDGRQFFIKDDPRVTRAGRVLRRCHLDELPQLWNVLVGQMSLVGPRPSPDDENQLCPAWRELRLSVRPGITGLWQLKCTRQEGIDFQEWVRFDTQYVERASFWFDLMILGQTVRKLLRRGEAHVSDETW